MAPEPASLGHFDYIRDDVRRRIYITAHGVLSADDLMGIVDRQMREKTWKYSMLYDLRAHKGITRGDVIMVAEHVRTYVDRFGSRGPVAVCARTMEMQGAGHRYAIESTKFGLNVEVFADLREAERWLDEQGN